jgi:hypothetical protein
MNTKVYLLNSMNIIIGTDEKDMIKNALKIIRLSQGEAIIPLFSSFLEKPEPIDIDKKLLNIMAIRDPKLELKEAYKRFLSGEFEGKRRIITPKKRLN